MNNETINFISSSNVNSAPYHVLLEIGDNAISKAFLEDPASGRKWVKRSSVKWPHGSVKKDISFDRKY